MRLRDDDDDDVQVALSPLIDCVFLLLIFFLVTTMMKKTEKQIPVTLPDQTSSLSDEPNDDIHILGLDASGAYYADSGKRGQRGEVIFQRIDDLARHLGALRSRRATDKPIRLDADPETPFQKIIEALDVAQLQGFENVGVHLKREPGRR